MIIYRRRHPLIRSIRQIFYKLYNFFKKLYWRVCKPTTQGVKMMVINSKGEILLARIGYMHKLWVIPGGKIERNELPINAVKRELFEEVGLKVGECKFLFTIYHEKQFKKDTVYYFEAFSDTNNFVIDDEEIIDVAWFPFNKLPEHRAERVNEALIKYNDLISNI